MWQIGDLKIVILYISVFGLIFGFGTTSFNESFAEVQEFDQESSITLESNTSIETEEESETEHETEYEESDTSIETEEESETEHETEQEPESYTEPESEPEPEFSIAIDRKSDDAEEGDNSKHDDTMKLDSNDIDFVAKESCKE